MSSSSHTNNLRLAILGGSPGNGHPYSWSALFNGYDRERMTKECPFPGIPAYLNLEPTESLTIPGAQVTHICCDDGGGFTAEHVATCAKIPHVVTEPTALIGQVDAVLVSTDIAGEHVTRARPFVEAGIPVFIDKPLADTVDDLKQFSSWVAAGRPIMSSSCLRYAKEFMPFRHSTQNLGELRFASITTMKSWETYGIHALEGIYSILGPGFETARNTGTEKRNIVHLTHRRGIDVVVTATGDMMGGFCCLQLCGTAGSAQTKFADSYYAFKAQLLAFITYLRTGAHPFPFTETEELMQLLIAGRISREQGGRSVSLSEITLI